MEPAPRLDREMGFWQEPVPMRRQKMSAAQPAVRLIRLPELKEMIGISRSTIYNKLNPNSKQFDPTFPKPRSLGANTVGWLESEVLAWILAR